MAHRYSQLVDHVVSGLPDLSRQRTEVPSLQDVLAELLEETRISAGLV